jgi:hypothetical protein
MITEVRKRYNDGFTAERYQALIDDVAHRYGVVPNFRIAESPFFIPKILKNRLIEACDLITDVILRPDIKEITQPTLYDPTTIVPGEDDHTIFLQMDYGITIDEHGDPMPQLIEVQGFPSVYFFQYMVSDSYRKVFDLPDYLSPFIDPEMTPERYKKIMHDIIVGDSDPRHVVLLEIEPPKQTTYIDMHSTGVELGIPVVCITEVIKRDRNLYYKDQQGQEIKIEKIYNRVIFDELYQRPDLRMNFAFTDDLDVEWIGHPNWFYRISKYIVPYLNNKYVPETYFLNQLETIPDDLQNWVLKPLFSFAGAGVIIDVKAQDIHSITDKSNYVLQRKVTYAPVIESPDEPVKVEVRMLMLWPKDAPRPYIVTNLSRLSKGKMIGVKYNKDKDWVGGSVGFFDHRD